VVKTRVPSDPESRRFDSCHGFEPYSESEAFSNNLTALAMEVVGRAIIPQEAVRSDSTDTAFAAKKSAVR
jgi:hypothetical protein